MTIPSENNGKKYHAHLEMERQPFQEKVAQVMEQYIHFHFREIRGLKVSPSRGGKMMTVTWENDGYVSAMEMQKFVDSVVKKAKEPIDLDVITKLCVTASGIKLEKS